MSLPTLRSDATAAELLRQLGAACPLLGGSEVVAKVASATTVQSVAHPLGRAYRGAFVVRASGPLPLTVLDPAGRPLADKRLYFQLSSPVAGSCALWVY